MKPHGFKSKRSGGVAVVRRLKNNRFMVRSRAGKMENGPVRKKIKLVFIAKEPVKSFSNERMLV